MTGLSFDIARWALPGAILPLAALMAAAVAALLFAAFSKARSSLVESGIAIAGLAAAALLAWSLWPEAVPGEASVLITDRLGLAGLIVVLSAAACAVLISQPHLGRLERGGGFYGLLMLSVFGMGALCFAGDLIAILIAMESMSIALSALAGSDRGRPQSLEASLKLFTMSAFSTAFYCMGLAFIFGSLGSTSLATIAERFGYVLSGEGRGIFLFGLAMVFSGLALKVSAAPFHAWAPDALDGSPIPVALLISTSAKAAALVALLRLAMAIAAPGGELWHGLASAVAAATIMWGSLAALRQESLRRMLAYLSVACGGFMLAALPSLAEAHGPMARALLMNLIAYSISMAGAFAALVALSAGAGEPLDLRHLCGMSRRRPWAAAAMALFLVSIAGIPPTLGFAGRFYLIMETARAGDLLLSAATALGTALMCACVARPIVAMYFRDAGPALAGKDPQAHASASSALTGVMAGAALAVLAFGVFPQNLMAFVYASAALL